VGLLLGLGSLLSFGCPQLLSDEFTVQTGSDPRLGDPITLDASRSPGGAGSGGSSAALDPSAVPPDGLDGPDDPDDPFAPDPGAPDTPDTPADPDGGVVGNQPGPPSVLNVSPADGASGVASDAVVTLTFSEAMDTSSVELAFSSFDLPVSAVSFSWTDGDTVLHITPDQPLTRATGTSTSTTFATPYAFEIDGSALDQEGSPLPPFNSAFSVEREITQTLEAVRDRSLTGNWREDNTYGTGECEQQDTAVCVGDSSSGNSAYRGFVTFNLSTLPAGVTDATAASLRLLVTSEVGGPFSTLGNLGAERVSFGSIDLAAFGAAPLGALAPLSDQNGSLSADVLAAVRADLPGHARSQFRVRFATGSDLDGTADLIASEWTTQTLQITYLIP